MTTELLLAPAVRSWDDVKEAISSSIADLVDGSVNEVAITVPEGSQRITATQLGDGQLRLAASGNDTLVGHERLTVRDERAVIAVGFSSTTASWGSFLWDWTAPVTPELVASGIVRTMRDIYKVASSDLELSVTL